MNQKNTTTCPYCHYNFQSSCVYEDKDVYLVQCPWCQVYLECPKEFALRLLAEENIVKHVLDEDGWVVDIPIESQKPPFQSEPFPGYVDSLKARIVELEATVQALKRCGNCEYWSDLTRHCEIGKFDTCPHNSYADWDLSKYYAERSAQNTNGKKK